MRADGLIATAIGMGLASLADAAPYTYLKLVDTIGPTSTLSAPSINGNGLVVVQAGLDLGGQQILLGAAPPLSVAAATAPAGDGPFISFGAQPALNLPGVVAFQSILPGGTQALYTDVGGPSTLVFDSTGVFEGFGQPAVNMGGQIAFTATLDGPVAGVYRTIPGGTTTVIADTNGPYSGFMGDVSLAVDGNVLFRAALDGGGFGIRLGSGGAAEPIVSTGPVYSSFAAHAMSSNGVIAFQAGHPDGSQGVYLIPDVEEQPTLIAHSDRPEVAAYRQRVESNPEGENLLIVGREAASGQSELIARTSDPIVINDSSFIVGGRTYDQPTQAVLHTMQHPDRPGRFISVFIANGDAGWSRLRLINFYTRDTTIIWDGDKVIDRRVFEPDRRLWFPN